MVFIVGSGGLCSILLFCRAARCFMTMVVFMSWSVMVSGLVLMFVVYLVFLNIGLFLESGSVFVCC